MSHWDTGVDGRDEEVDFDNMVRPFAPLEVVKVNSSDAARPAAAAVVAVAAAVAAGEGLRNAYLEVKVKRCFRSDSLDMVRFGYLAPGSCIGRLTKKVMGKKWDLGN